MSDTLSAQVSVLGHEITVSGSRESFCSCEGDLSYILATHEASVDITSIIQDAVADLALDEARKVLAARGAL